MNQRLTRFSLVGLVGVCLATLSTISVRAQSKRSYAPASVHALPGLQCKVFPLGGTPSSGVTVFTDSDGYARFHAVRAVAGDKVQRLTLDCRDSAGRNSSYPVDLNSDSTFVRRPLNVANERGIDRPALQGDPLSYSPSQLIQAGYGLRPDPVKDAAAYSRWLAAASRPGRFLEAIRPDKHSHGVTSTQSPWWVGSVLTGAPNYIATQATFNVPTGIPGGDGTTSTEIAIWNGLGGFNTGSGLIQGGVSVSTTPNAASYSSWREYCCGDPNSNGYGGAFTPNPGDQIFSQEWYCDSTGNLDLNGGYGCTFLQDMTSGAILNCSLATGSPCWSVKALPLCSASPATPNCMTLGLAAEFVIEDQSPQVLTSSTAFTDFTPTVAMVGSAYSSKTNAYSQTISTDPTVYLLTDFTNTTSHIYVSLGVTDQTYFSSSPPTSNRLDVFWIGPDGGIGSTAWEGGVNNNGWANTFPVASPGVARADSPITAVARTPNRLDVFWIGPDGGIGSTAWEGGVNNNGWATAFPITKPGAARPGSPIAAVARTPNRLDVFWIGPDGAIGSTAWEGGVNNNGWATAFPITNPGVARADSSITGVARQSPPQP